MTAPRVVKGRRCGYPARRCGYPARRCGYPAEVHADAQSGQGERRPWTYHDQACPIRGTDPAFDDRCSFIRDHAGVCFYTSRPGSPGSTS